MANEGTYRTYRGDVGTIAFNHASVLACPFNNISKTKSLSICYIAHNTFYYISFTLTSNYILMILHVIISQRRNNLQLFSLDEITGNYFTPVTSIIAISFIWNKFHDLILNHLLKLSVSCNKVRILLTIYLLIINHGWVILHTHTHTHTQTHKW